MAQTGQESKGTSVSAQGLHLLPFVFACPAPILLLPVPPLSQLLTSVNSKWPPNSFSSFAWPTDPMADREDDRLAMPPFRRQSAANLPREDRRAFIRSSIDCLRSECVNAAWMELARNNTVYSQPPDAEYAADSKMGSDGEERELELAPVDVLQEALALLLSESERGDLLTRLLNFIAASNGDPPKPTLSFNSCTISITLLPSRSHFVLMATVLFDPSPIPSTLSTSLPLLHSPASSPAPFNPVPPPPILPRNTALTAVDKYTQALGETLMGRMIRDYPWVTTSLGRIADWAPELKCMVSVMLASPYRECILYGPDHILIYNDHYIQACGKKHPFLLGKSFRVGWAEIWDDLEPVAKKVMQGETHYSVDTSLAMARDRDDLLEETYHTFSYSPFRNAEGTVIGFLNLSLETTQRVIAERRLATVRDLVQNTSWQRNIPDFCAATIACFGSNVYDMPFAALYTCTVLDPKLASKHVRSKDEKNRHTSVELSCRGSVGIPEGHPFAPSSTIVDLQHFTDPRSPFTGSSGGSTTMMDTSGTVTTPPIFSWPFEDACRSLEPVFIADLGELTASLEPRGWEERPRQAVVFPLTAEAGQVIPSGVLIVGINSRGKYDALYKTFLQLVAHHIGIGILAVTNAETEARRAAELVALDRAKTNFFSNTSHELRTPLTLVLGPLEDVLNNREEPIGAANREKLQVVQRHANRLLGMVNKLLDFSSLEGGRMNLKFRPVKIGQITRDLATLFRDAISRTKIKYTIDCHEDPPDAMPVYLAVELWEKVVFNLIGNAFKYCQSGTIEIKVLATHAEAVFSVRDTGVGIPRSELSLIFERFHRIEATSQSTAGTGIGLALTLEVVKALGGQMEVESEPGVGSIFSVRLPRGFTHLPIGQVVHEAEDRDTVSRPLRRNRGIIEEATAWRDESLPAEYASASGSGSSSSGSASGGDSSAEDFLVGADLLNFKNSVVLLAEDSSDLRNYIAGILGKAFTVVPVEDGQAALEYALRKPVSLVVSDIMMPKLDGRGLLKALRANASTSLIPVIFLSAMAGPEARAEALETGADDYLVKPFQARELLARVNVHLQLNKMRKELERRVDDRTRALHESELKYKRLADRYSTLSTLSPVGIFLTDHQGNLSYANPQFFAISGMPTEEPIENWMNYIIAEDREKVDAFWKAALDGSLDAKQRNLELRYIDGNWAQLELRQFRDEKNQEGYVGAVTDVTTQKTVEALHRQGIEQRMLDVEETRRQQSEFVDLASHELRNPLSGVMQNAEVLGVSLDRLTEFVEDLQRGSTPDAEIIRDLLDEMAQNHEAVESIILCASHQGRIADDILNVSKLNMGLLSITLAPFDLGEKVKEVLRMFEIDCTQKRIDLQVVTSPSIPALGASCIVADASRLAQILINFLANSVKYTSESVLRRIIVHLDAYEQIAPKKPGAIRVAEPEDLTIAPNQLWVSIGVEDTGKGLSSDDLKKLFIRFSQANPRSDQYGGSGLGLYVCKKLVELHHGFIEVESAPGKGSIFRFAVPAARGVTLPHPSPEIHSSLSAPVYRSKRPSTSTSSSRHPAKNARTSAESTIPIHVLVVEDNKINQVVLTRQLKMENFQVTVANNGREGLDTLLSEGNKQGTDEKGKGKISIVLMDIEMPVMDGISAIRELRSLEKTGAVAHHYNVIAVTGNARQAQIEECLSSGFDAVAIKPYRINDLLQQIRQLTSLPKN